MKLTFLGTNGWFDSSVGNTPSALLETSLYYIIFDAGFGIAKADEHIKEDKPIFLFLSHFHIDHICGLHVLPKFHFKHGLTVFGSGELKKVFKIFVNSPYAAPLDYLDYKVNLKPLKEGKYTKPFEFSCKKLRHHDLALGYRLRVDDKTVVYCSDTAICENDYLLARDADLLIHECGFMPGETGAWGHSNPEEVAALANKANVKHLALTHFGAAGYSSLAIKKNAEALAKKIFPNTVAAADGLVLEI
jgi:ribonuclease BN (tRNA processing enzyme)